MSNKLDLPESIKDQISSRNSNVHKTLLSHYNDLAKDLPVYTVMSNDGQMLWLGFNRDKANEIATNFDFQELQKLKRSKFSANNLQKEGVTPWIYTPKGVMIYAQHPYQHGDLQLFPTTFDGVYNNINDEIEYIKDPETINKILGTNYNPDDIKQIMQSHPIGLMVSKQDNYPLAVESRQNGYYNVHDTRIPYSYTSWDTINGQHMSGQDEKAQNKAIQIADNFKSSLNYFNDPVFLASTFGAGLANGAVSATNTTITNAINRAGNTILGKAVGDWIVKPTILAEIIDNTQRFLPGGTTASELVSNYLKDNLGFNSVVADVIGGAINPGYWWNPVTGRFTAQLNSRLFGQQSLQTNPLNPTFLNWKSGLTFNDYAPNFLNNYIDKHHPFNLYANLPQGSVLLQSLNGPKKIENIVDVGGKLVDKYEYLKHLNTNNATHAYSPDFVKRPLDLQLFSKNKLGYYKLFDFDIQPSSAIISKIYNRLTEGQKRRLVEVMIRSTNGDGHGFDLAELQQYVKDNKGEMRPIIKYILTGIKDGSLEDYAYIPFLSHGWRKDMYTGLQEVNGYSENVENDLITALLYGKQIDKRTGILPDSGYGLHDSYVRENYPDRDVSVYKLSRNIPNKEQNKYIDVGVDNRMGGEEADYYINAAGHIARLYDDGSILEQDIFKYNPNEYFNKWIRSNLYNKDSNDWLNQLFGLMQIHKFEKPVITRVYHLSPYKRYRYNYTNTNSNYPNVDKSKQTIEIEYTDILSDGKPFTFSRGRLEPNSDGSYVYRYDVEQSRYEPWLAYPPLEIFEDIFKELPNGTKIKFDFPQHVIPQILRYYPDIKYENGFWYKPINHNAKVNSQKQTFVDFLNKNGISNEVLKYVNLEDVMNFAKERYGKHFGSQSSFNLKNNKKFYRELFDYVEIISRRNKAAKIAEDGLPRIRHKHNDNVTPNE